ncbi:MAG TPA: hypothetical protein VME68_01690 [Acidobacteriaceae bacterium]|nr:hypothetical protein [Acidobacteriaceae bacterium]
MPPQTTTRAAETNLEPSVIYRVLAEPSNIPRWAPTFADAIERVDGHFRVTKIGETFDVEVVLHPSALAVDIVRSMANNRRGGAYVRVTPRPMGGSSIAITVPLAPNVDEAEAAKTLEQELADLIGLAQR